MNISLPAFSFSLIIFLRLIQLPFFSMRTAATAAQHGPGALSIYSPAIIPDYLARRGKFILPHILSLYGNKFVSEKYFEFSPRQWFHQYKKSLSLAPSHLRARRKALVCTQLLEHRDPLARKTPCTLYLLKSPKAFPEHDSPLICFISRVSDRHT